MSNSLQENISYFGFPEVLFLVHGTARGVY